MVVRVTTDAESTSHMTGNLKTLCMFMCILFIILKMTPVVLTECIFSC